MTTEDKLNQYSNFDENEENCDKFLDIVYSLCDSGNIKNIGNLFKYFDDKTDYSWVLQIMMKSMLSIDDEKCIILFLTNLHYFIKKAPNWCGEAFNVIFNSTEVIDCFENNMHLAKKEDLLKLFNLMEKEYPYHKELIEKLRKKL